VACINPALRLSQHTNCGASPEFEASAMLRLRNGEGIVFTPQNKFHKCQNMNDITNGGGTQCMAAKNVAADIGLDPNKTRFALGPIDGAVESMGETESSTRYYLFMGTIYYLLKKSFTVCFGVWFTICLRLRFIIWLNVWFTMCLRVSLTIF
jgi:hypothetical protein